MLNRDPIRLVGTMLLGAVVMLVTLTACGGANAGGAALGPATPQATAASQSTPTAIATATMPKLSPTTVATANPAPTTVAPGPTTVAPGPTPSPTGTSDSDLLAQGKLIFEKTAGGLGCAYCHGLNGKGAGQAGIPAPDIRGKNEGTVRIALQGGVPMMMFIKLSDDQITAVVAYLQYLAAQ